MKNTAAATYYEDNNYIATMEDELESTSGKPTILKSSTGSMNLSHTTSNKCPSHVAMNNRVD